MKTKKSLELWRQRLVNVLETVHDGFFALDRDWRYVYLNPTAEKYARVKRESLVGKIIWEEFPRSKNTLFFKKYHEAMETGREIEFEEKIDNKWFDIHVVPFTEGIWVFYRDISEGKLADDRKDEFIRMASHELKTPITSLKLYAELLQEMIPDGEAGEYLRHISEQAEKLNRLVTEMLDLSRIQLGKIGFNKKEIDLIQVIEELLPELEATTSHHFKITYKAHKAPIYADKVRLTQAISNIIENAVKYSPGKNRVLITLDKDEKNVSLAIKDYGVGIDPAYRDKIFDRFFQATGTKGKAFPGLGIGLYITKKIIDKHQGQIKVKSILGKGSTFTIVLPLYEKKNRLKRY